MTRADRNEIAGAEVPAVDIPDCGEPTWHLFWALRSAKTTGERLGPRDLIDHGELMGVRVDRQLIPAIFQMDAAFVPTMAEEIRVNTERKAREAR